MPQPDSSAPELPAPAADFDRKAIEAIQDPVARLRVLMKRLLDPGGCPWDREQTHATLKKYLIEESYEFCEAVDRGNAEEMREELGDVALQVVFHAELAERAGAFTLEDAYAAICKKLLDRHPHVFGETKAADAAQVLQNWEKQKQKEKALKQTDSGAPAGSILDGVPQALPALQRAKRLQEKASRVGFDWAEPDAVAEKVREEVQEFLERAAASDQPGMNEELGDLLFSLVNLSRFLGLDPEEALRGSCKKFAARFNYIEAEAGRQGRVLSDMKLEEMDRLWDAAKEARG